MSIMRLNSLIDETKIVEMASRLIQFDTSNPPGQEAECAKFIGDYLVAAGFDVELIHHTTDRASLLARLEGKGERKSLLWNGHIDVVPIGEEPWAHEPFNGIHEEDRVWGRGAADMKGGDAAMLVAARAIAESGIGLRGDLILAMTAGEEGEQLGAAAIVERNDLPAFQAIMIPEPSSNEIFIAEKGALWVEFRTEGISAHGSMPQVGCNAIRMMFDLLNKVDALEIPHEPHPLLGGFTRSLGTFHGGQKANVVPDHCVAQVDMRTVPGQEHDEIIQQIAAALDELEERSATFRGTYRVINNLPPVESDPDHPAVQRIAQAWDSVMGSPSEFKGAVYYTDGAVLAPVLGAPLVILGPGDPEQAHQTDEYVDIHRMVETARIYAQAAAIMLGDPTNR